MAPRWRRTAPKTPQSNEPPRPPTQQDGSQYSVAAIAYDLETTGPNPKHCEVIQFAAVCANCGPTTPTIAWAQTRGAMDSVHDTPHYVSLVMPKGHISDESYRIHGYHLGALLAMKAAPFRKVWMQFVDYIYENFGRERPLVFCAHSGTYFDHVILRREVERAGLGIPSHWKFVDTLPIARKLFPARTGKGSYTLGRLYSDLNNGEPLDGAHDALVDSTALAAIWAWVEAGLEWDPEDLILNPDRKHVLFQQRLQQYVYGKDTADVSKLERETCDGAQRRLDEVGDDDEYNGTMEEKPLYRTTSLLTGRPWTAAAEAEEAWYSAWQARFECWWLRLPVPTQAQLGNCLGAMGLHLGNRLHAARAMLGRSLPPPLSPTALGDPDPGCEFLLEGGTLQVPSFPEFTDFEFELPPLPGLLPRWERETWESLMGYDQPRLMLSGAAPPEHPSSGSGFAHFFAGAAAGVGVFPVLLLSRCAFRHVWRKRVRLGIRPRLTPGASE